MRISVFYIYIYTRYRWKDINPLQRVKASRRSEFNKVRWRPISCYFKPFPHFFSSFPIFKQSDFIEKDCRREVFGFAKGRRNLLPSYGLNLELKYLNDNITINLREYFFIPCIGSILTNQNILFFGQKMLSLRKNAPKSRKCAPMQIICAPVPGQENVLWGREIVLPSQE